MDRVGLAGRRDEMATTRTDFAESPRSLLTRRAVLRLAVSTTAAALVAACVAEVPGWTYAPAPSPTQAASAAPSPSAAPTPPPSGPSASPSEGAVVIRIRAQNIKFDLSEFSVPANTPFEIVFENLDAGIPHNVAIYEGQAGGPTLFQGEIFNGVETRTYQVPGLSAGAHYFMCDVHPTMNGTVRVA
jgi:plastocyanin